MLDLKPYFDAVNTAEAEVQRIAHEIDALFTEGSEESGADARAKALELRPALDAAQAKHAEAISLYESMQKADRPNDVAKNFVPITDVRPDQAEGNQPTVIKREAYDGMSLVNRAMFIRSGGKLED